MEKQSSNKRIRMLINELGITQTEFCQKTGITKSALSNYLNGDRTPRQDQISKIAEAYNINPSWLMGYNVPFDIEVSYKINDESFNGKSFMLEPDIREGNGIRQENIIKAYVKGINPEGQKILNAYDNADALTKAMVRRTLGLDK